MKSFHTTTQILIPNTSSSYEHTHARIEIRESNLWEEQHSEMQKHNHYLQLHHDSTEHLHNILLHHQYQPAEMLMPIKLFNISLYYKDRLVSS